LRVGAEKTDEFQDKKKANFREEIIQLTPVETLHATSFPPLNFLPRNTQNSQKKWERKYNSMWSKIFGLGCGRSTTLVIYPVFPKWWTSWPEKIRHIQPQARLQCPQRPPCPPIGMACFMRIKKKYFL
jgi:hypothetical protein